MNGAGASSPLGLRIPAAASPAGSNNTTTGRPPLWTSSTQRKVTRLYLYTTLSLAKIIEVVHAKSPETAPGKDSANKNLSTLLDKEPRWLRAKDEDDMGRRLNELSLSPTRSHSSLSSSPRPHAASDPPPYNPDLSASASRDRDTNFNFSPAALEVPPFHQFPTSSPRTSTSDSAGGSMLSPNPPEPLEQDPSAFSRFLRQPTCMSTSTQDTQRTTGSIQRVLAEYSQPYVQTVRKLIRRYTAPLSHHADSLSPMSDLEFRPAQTSWSEDPDAPPVLDKPRFLPGDYLTLDRFILETPQCNQSSANHRTRACLCFVRDEIQDPMFMTLNGLTPHALSFQRLGGVVSEESSRDCFNNTPLHLMAAQGWIESLVHALEFTQPDILNEQNTAGQTFLHALGPVPEELEAGLYHTCYEKGFDFSARDHYGRTIWHLVCAAGMLESPDRLQGLMWVIPPSVEQTDRDAFGNTPPARPGAERPPETNMRQFPTMPGTSFQTTHDRDIFVEAEARLLECVRVALEYPVVECEDGRNGLHCLAAATLSQTSLLRKYELDNAPPPEKRRKSQEPKDLDSSTERMTVRLQMLTGLLEAGVDPNHYDRDGNTPLMAFVALLPEDDDYKVGPAILEKLIASGAEVNARNRRGETALHVAVRCGRKRAAKVLCEQGANVHVRDAAGRSLLEVVDVKMKSASGVNTKEYAHYEACRAWLSGKGFAVQSPTLMQEWCTPKSS